MNLPNLQMKNKYVFVVAPLMFISVMLAFVAYPLFYDKVYEGVKLEGLEVGGKTQAELSNLLAEWNDRSQGKKILVYHDDKTYSMRYQDIGFAIDTDGTLETVWNYGRIGSWYNRVISIQTLRNSPQNLPLRVTIDDPRLNAQLEAWKQTINKPPHNATVSLATGGIIPESKGRKLMEEELKALLIRAFSQDDIQQIAMPVATVEPKVTVDSLRQSGIVVMQSSFSTRFNTEDEKRSTNIRIASEKINGLLLQPGQTFSFNEIVGPRDKASGFQEALEFYDGELVPGIGGGVCQVSSTLYNAALLANLDITERINHARPLSYISLGRDATVAYGVLDFKFVNSSGSPVMIVSEVKDDTLQTAIFGREKIQEKIDIIVTDQKEIAPVTVKKPDALLPVGKTIIENKGAPGYELKVYRLVSHNGKVVKREFLSKDQYQADNIVIKVGVKKQPGDIKK